MRRFRNPPEKPKPSCKKHPGIPAVRDGLCTSCLHYAKLAEKLNPRGVPGVVKGK